MWGHFSFPSGLGLPSAVPAFGASGLEKGDMGAGRRGDSSSWEVQRAGQSWGWGVNPDFPQPGLPHSPGTDSTQKRVRRQSAAGPQLSKTPPGRFPTRGKAVGEALRERWEEPQEGTRGREGEREGPRPAGTAHTGSLGHPPGRTRRWSFPACGCQVSDDGASGSPVRFRARLSSAPAGVM